MRTTGMTNTEGAKNGGTENVTFCFFQISRTSGDMYKLAVNFATPV